jgi:predicted site-specific integrase-resolvase
MDTREMIKTLGGTRAVARYLGVAPSTVHHYIKTGKIPLHRLMMLMPRLHEKGVVWPLNIKT